MPIGITMEFILQSELGPGPGQEQLPPHSTAPGRPCRGGALFFDNCV